MASSNRTEIENLADSSDKRPVKKTKLGYDRFRQIEIRCYETQEYGSVYFSSFNPVHPILACGLIDGAVLFIEGKTQTDSMNLWDKKYKVDTKIISAMTDLAWNSDGNLLNVSFFDGKMSIWHRDNEKLVELSDPDGEQIWAIAWNHHFPDVFLTRNNQSILVWGDAECSPQVLKPRFNFHTNIIREVAWISQDQFASSSDDGSILLCQIGKDSPLKSLSLGDAVLSLSWNSSSNLLASLTRDGSIEVWSMDKNNSDYVLKNTRPKRPCCFAWQYRESTTTVDDNTIACGLEDGSVIVWNIRENSDAARSLREQTNSIWSVSFSPDGKFLASIDLQGDIVIWSTKDWKISFQSKLSYHASKQTLLWGGNGHKLAFANPSQQVHVIEAVGDKQ